MIDDYNASISSWYLKLHFWKTSLVRCTSFLQNIFSVASCSKRILLDILNDSNLFYFFA